MKRNGHFTVRSGKRVMLHMADGTKIIAKFKEKHIKYISFFDFHDVALVDIRTITIYKGAAA